MPPRKRLGQLLTELKVIDDHQLQSALGHQRQWGGKLGAILVQKGFCGEDQLVSALAQHLSMERVKLLETKIDPRAVKLVSKPIAEKLHVFPYQVSGSGRSEVISIAMSDPTDLSAVDQLAFHTGKRIKPLLASDGEIVAAIQANYGGAEEKKEATDKLARPSGSAAAAAPVAGAGFPKRIEPQPPAAAAPAPRPPPFAPPTPVPPAKPAAPPQKVEEAPPVGAAAPVPAAPVAPVDLPEDDADDLGLEPIAAHSQFGDQVSGQEDVAGDGSAADTIEGLVSASLAHEGAEQARSASALESAEEAAPAAGDEWGEPAKDLEADAAAPAEAAWPQLETAAAAEQGWGTPLKTDEASWAVAQPATEVPSAWPTSTSGDGWSMEEPSTSAGWSTAESAQPWNAEGGAAAPEEPPSEALPTDAILGAVQEFAEDPEESGGAGWDAEEPPAQPDRRAAALDASAPESQDGADLGMQAEIAAELQGEPAPQTEADATPETQGESPPEMEAEAAPEMQAEAAPEMQAEAAPEPQVEAPPDQQLDPSPPLPEELFAASGSDDIADPLMEAPAELSPEPASELGGLAREPDTEPIPVRPAYAVAAEEHEAEPPDAWGAIDDPLAAQAAPGIASSIEEDVPAAAGSAEDLAAPELASADADAQAVAVAEPDAASVSVDVDSSTFEAGDTAAAGLEFQEAESARWQPAPEESAAPVEAGSTRESTERFARQDAGWIGEALGGATPLSPADLGTLASIGIEPGDGVGALRLLATLIRILNRSQLIEPDELRAEIRESREAAAAAVQPPNGVESEGSSGAEAQEPGTVAET